MFVGDLNSSRKWSVYIWDVFFLHCTEVIGHEYFYLSHWLCLITSLTFLIEVGFIILICGEIVLLYGDRCITFNSRVPLSLAIVLIRIIFLSFVTEDLAFSSSIQHSLPTAIVLPWFLVFMHLPLHWTGLVMCTCQTIACPKCWFMDNCIEPNIPIMAKGTH
jgi:hypothetical protein